MGSRRLLPPYDPKEVARLLKASIAYYLDDDLPGDVGGCEEERRVRAWRKKYGVTKRQDDWLCEAAPAYDDGSGPYLGLELVFPEELLDAWQSINVHVRANLRYSPRDGCIHKRSLGWLRRRADDLEKIAKWIRDLCDELAKDEKRNGS